MKILVLGDGLLGSTIINKTNWDYISRKKDSIDITNSNTWKHKLKGYDVIVNCIAYTNTYDTNKQPNWDINYKAISDIVKICNNNKQKLIQISTDYIYAYSKSNCSEEEVPVHLDTWYGYTKLLGDAYVQLECNDYLVIRESHKPYPFPYSKAWDNQFTNGDYVTIIADIIIKLIIQGAVGVYNVGTETKTWYDLTSKEFNTIPTLATKGAPLNITMNLDKLNTFLNDK
jgi:dTDP-4-dehydrorhamnose reductase